MRACKRFSKLITLILDYSESIDSFVPAGTSMFVQSRYEANSSPSYEMAMECQNLLNRILCISLIASDNLRVLSYMWKRQICSQDQGFVTHFRFTADEKIHPRIFFI